MSDARTLPMVIGPTENALRSLLSKVLSATLITDYECWVVLNAASATAPGTSDWRARAAAGLARDVDAVEATVARLHATGLLDDLASPTPRGRNELDRARAAVGVASRALVEGIDPDDQATVRRVLDLVRERAEALVQG